MKIFTQGILARRKMVLIFILAILLPSLIVGYLSLTTFAKRRETVKRALESSLWVSGEAALKSIEDVLLEHERDVLKRENFIRLTQPKKADQSLSVYSTLAKNIAGLLFLLDNNYQIIIPKTGSEDGSVFQWEKDVSDSQFDKTLQGAESFEFSQKNYSRAAELYRKCATSTPSRQHKAIALEGLGRCKDKDFLFGFAPNSSQIPQNLPTHNWNDNYHIKTERSMAQKANQLRRDVQYIKFKIDFTLHSAQRINKGRQKYSPLSSAAIKSCCWRT